MITLETKTFDWKIYDACYTLDFTAAGSGENHLDTAAAPQQFCRLALDGREIMPAGTAFRGGQLIVDFPGVGSVSLDTEIRERYLVLRVAAAPDGCDRLLFLDVPLRQGAADADDFVACALSLNLQTRGCVARPANAPGRPVLSEVWHSGRRGGGGGLPVCADAGNS